MVEFLLEKLQFIGFTIVWLIGSACALILIVFFVDGPRGKKAIPGAVVCLVVMYVSLVHFKSAGFAMVSGILLFLGLGAVFSKD